jgi:hypothetical protein
MAPNRPSDQSGAPVTPEPAQAPDPTATADYVVAMTQELAALSRRAGLDLLAYFLDIARLEALEQARRTRVKP